VALVKLDPTVQAADLPIPDVKPVSDCFTPGADATGRQPAIRALHVALLSTLTAADFRLGKAYGLGRSLADTCREPESWAELQAEFEPMRVTRLRARIDDLASAFPGHAGHSVSESLGRWADFVAKPPTKKTAEAEKQALSALVRQGQLWRSLLSGEKAGPDMLEIPDYLDAAGRLLRTTRRLVWRFVRHFPFVVLVILALLGGGVYLMLNPEITDSTLTGAGGIVAGLGLTWMTLGSTLGGLGGKLEQHVWEAELDIAITDAITMAPIGSGRPGPPTEDVAQTAGAASPPTRAPDGTPSTTPPATPSPDPTLR
jgi:hypothetical protein